MKRKIMAKIGIFLVIIMLIYPTIYATGYTEKIDTVQKNADDKIVSISLETYDATKNDFVQKKIAEITLEEAEIIKEKLITIEEQYEAEKIIKKQMEVLHDYELLPSSMVYEDYEIVLERMKEKYPHDLNSDPTKDLLAVGYTSTGPSIMSTLAFGGQTFQLKTILGAEILQYYFDEDVFDYQNDNLFNGTHLHSSAYAGPVFVAFSPSSAFITIIGFLVSGPQVIYSPFVDIRVVFAGGHLSATIFECQSPITLFDWHINVAMMGVLIFQDNVQAATPQEITTDTTMGRTGREYLFSTETVDLEGDPIYFKFDWDDGTQSDWIGPYDNFEEVQTMHRWDTPGTYNIRVKAKDDTGPESDWSEPYTFKITDKHPFIINFIERIMNQFNIAWYE